MNVLVLLPVTDAHKAKLESSMPGECFIYVAPTSEVGAQVTLEAAKKRLTSEQIAEADVVIGNLAPSRLPEASNLKMLQLNSAGYDNYLAAGTVPEQVAFASASGAYGQAVSEHLFAMTLGMMKRLPGYLDEQRARRWSDLGAVTSMRGARVLVLGEGNIGTRFATLCRNMGAHVEGAKRNTLTYPTVFECMHGMDELEDALASADVVASFLPSTDATRGLADEAFFAQMKPGAFFANGGRGDLVDYDALVAALSSGHLAGAALDVTAPEPLPQDSPLWDVPNLYITPHISGFFHLQATLDNIVDIAAENLRHFAAGETLRNQIAH